MADGTRSRFGCLLWQKDLEDAVSSEVRAYLLVDVNTPLTYGFVDKEGGGEPPSLTPPMDPRRGFLAKLDLQDPRNIRARRDAGEDGWYLRKVVLMRGRKRAIKALLDDPQKFLSHGLSEAEIMEIVFEYIDLLEALPKKPF